MKRYNNLFEKIVSIDNLYLADKKARKNIKHKMCKKVAAMNKLKHMTYSEYRQQVCSHIGWMKHCNGINLLKKMIKYHQLIEYARSS